MKLNDTEFSYRGHMIRIEQSHEYCWLPLSYCFSIDGRYAFNCNGKFRKFQTYKAARMAAERVVEEEGKAGAK